MITLHPLRLRLRTNANVSTLFHSFYLAEYENNAVKIIHRIPAHKYQLENIEAGLMGFLSDMQFIDSTKEVFGNFAITTSNGSLFNAFYRGSKERVFVGVSEYFFPSFARQIFQDLGIASGKALYSTMLELCEEPVLPMSNISYSFQIGAVPRIIRFSSVDQTDDSDFSTLALNLLTPQMLVSAWESLMIEERVLVVSNNISIIQYICELLRRLVLPLSIVTFSPFLPKEALPAIEAPFPYLVGGCSRHILDSMVDLSETVIMDLDCRRVIHGGTREFVESTAPPRLVRQLLNSLHQVMVAPLNELISRPTNLLSDSSSSSSRSSSCRVIDKIINTFMAANISLLTSRACGSSEVPTFFRRGGSINPCASGANSPFQPTKQRPYLGFYRQSASEDNASGTMQLLRERYTDDENGSFVACWIEMDDMTFSVYEFVDDVPMAYFSIKDIRSVSPLAIEPEGHVFEMILTYGKSYRFVATDPEARKGWVDFIEERMNMCKKQGNRLSMGPLPVLSGQSSGIGVGTGGNGPMSAVRGNKVNNPSPSRSHQMSFAAVDSFQDRDMVLSSVKAISYRDRDRRDLNDSFAIRENSNLHASSIRFLAQLPADSSMLAPGQYEDSTPIIGYEDYSQDPNLSTTALSPDEDSMLSQFRYKVNQTQMVKNFYSSIDCSDYESMFRQLGAEAPLAAFSKDMFQNEVFPSFEQLLPTHTSMSIVDFVGMLLGSNSSNSPLNRAASEDTEDSQLNTGSFAKSSRTSSFSDNGFLRPETFVLYADSAYLESKSAKSKASSDITVPSYSEKRMEGVSLVNQLSFLSPIGEHPDESRLSLDSRPSPRPDIADEAERSAIKSEAEKEGSQKETITNNAIESTETLSSRVASVDVPPFDDFNTVPPAVSDGEVPLSNESALPVSAATSKPELSSAPASRSNSTDGGKWLNIKIHKVAVPIDSLSSETQGSTVDTQPTENSPTEKEDEKTRNSEGELSININQHSEVSVAAETNPNGSETASASASIAPLRVSKRRHTIALSKETADYYSTVEDLDQLDHLSIQTKGDSEALEPVPPMSPAVSPTGRPSKPAKPSKSSAIRLSFSQDGVSATPSRTASVDSSTGILPPLDVSNPVSPVNSLRRSPQKRSKSVTEISAIASIRQDSVSKDLPPLTPTTSISKDAQPSLTSSTSKRFSMKFAMSWTKGIYRKTERVRYLSRCMFKGSRAMKGSLTILIFLLSYESLIILYHLFLYCRMLQLKI